MSRRLGGTRGRMKLATPSGASSGCSEVLKKLVAIGPRFLFAMFQVVKPVFRFLEYLSLIFIDAFGRPAKEPTAVDLNLAKDFSDYVRAGKFRNT